MSFSSSSTVCFEGHSINKPHLFDGTNYQFWSNKMSIYMRSYDYQIWDVVVDGPFVPIKTKGRSEEIEPKQ